MITVTSLVRHLRMEVAGHTVVDTTGALVLEESGLPPRYYVPPSDIDMAFLAPSDRQSVCTYKGEARYHHLQSPGCRIDNAAWSYPDAWTDFAPAIGRIAGLMGLYTSAFDRIQLDGIDQDISSSEAAADKAMIANPTIDQVLRAKT